MSLKYPKYVRPLFYGVVFSLLVMTATVHAEMKVGIVDMNRVFTEYNKTKRAQADYLVVEKGVNKDMEDRLALLKQEVEKINQLDAELDKTDLTGDALLAKKKERDEDIAKAKKMDEEISEFRASKQKKFQDEFLEKRKEIIGEIMKIIDEQTQIRGFDLVLDKSGLSAGAVPVVLYTRPEFDISNDIITILNKKDEAKKDDKKSKL
ncbi:MAG: OmpH family outer membrane protein [Chthoniobacterales bacterium]|nr:OmpH family outer membrane protein [Chthoniobacterales bacterium]